MSDPLFPRFFIVGVGRSGTTLVRAIVIGHPRLEVPPETGFLPRLWRTRGLWWGEAGVRADIFARLAFANGRLGRAGVERGDLVRALDSHPPATPRQAVSRLYELFAVPDVTTGVGDKTPGYVEHVSLLSRAFPGARFIHVVRHPLDVVASLTRQPWGPNDPLAAGWLWLRSVRAAARANPPAGTLLTVRLEDLVAEPSKWVVRISDHLGEKSHPDMLRFSERAEGIQQQSVHPEGHMGLSRPLGLAGRWREDLDEDSAAQVWSLVRCAAGPLGYMGPAGALPRVSEPAAAARLALFDAARTWRRGRTLARVVSR